jgi:hypothetical protein
MEVTKTLMARVKKKNLGTPPANFLGTVTIFISL